jgi:hypothetical protein
MKVELDDLHSQIAIVTKNKVHRPSIYFSSVFSLYRLYLLSYLFVHSLHITLYYFTEYWNELKLFQ